MGKAVKGKTKHVWRFKKVAMTEFSEGYQAALRDMVKMMGEGGEEQAHGWAERKFIKGSKGLITGTPEERAARLAVL